MANNPKPERRRGDSKKPADDVFRVVLFTRDREALARLLREQPLDVDHVHYDEVKKGIEADFYLNEDQIAGLKKAGWTLDVHENMSEIGRARQKEVAKGDRFRGGKVAPAGLGIKTKKTD
jgi:hypothetical protein